MPLRAAKNPARARGFCLRLRGEGGRAPTPLPPAGGLPPPGGLKEWLDSMMRFLPLMLRTHERASLTGHFEGR